LRKLALLLPFLSLNCFAEDGMQDNNYSVGLGIGAMYAGLGTNFSLVSKNDLKYISAGCVEYNSSTKGTCGFGLGWIKTDLFDTNSNKHGFGLYVSLTGSESYVSYTSSSTRDESFRHDSDIYGAGVSYTYFMNGIDEPGTTFGLSIHATNADFEDSYGGFFQVGYQF
jgi:hypothetical protein|tara:strand:- start:8132 stop:8635 length:504 start_codon:yes stop_codon:yes gene_type:complete